MPLLATNPARAETKKPTMSKYTSSPTLFNLNPEQGKPRQGGWKTVQGWSYQAKKVRHCLLRNETLRGRRYTFHVTINIPNELSELEHKKLWKSANKKLKHISAFFVREPDVDNHINYHLIIADDIQKARLREHLDEAFPQATATISAIKSSYAIVTYILKLGQHKDKRLYFAKECKLNKVGSIGQFWQKPQKQLWQQCIDRERNIEETAKDIDLYDEAKNIHDLIDGFFPFRRILRNLALARLRETRYIYCQRTIQAPNKRKHQ